MAPPPAPQASAGSRALAVVRAFLASLLHFLSTSWNATVTLWRLTLQWINSYVLYFDYGGKPATDFYHKAVLIGDGVAQGFGAWISLGAPSGAMRYLNEGVRIAASIKMDWVFFERGTLNSTTQDWLPGEARITAGEEEDVVVEETEESKMTGEQSNNNNNNNNNNNKKKSSLLDAVLTSRSGRDVCLVIVLVGLQDMLQIKDTATLMSLAAAAAAAAAAATEEQKVAPLVDNLETIARHLLAQSQAPHVCLCTLPTVGAPSSIRARAIHGVNAQITRMVQRLKQEEGRAGRITLVDLSQRRVSREEGRAVDGVHFTSIGYKSLADALLDELSTPMAKHEWSILQEYVTGRRRRQVSTGRRWLRNWFGVGVVAKHKVN